MEAIPIRVSGPQFLARRGVLVDQVSTGNILVCGNRHAADHPAQLHRGSNFLPVPLVQFKHWSLGHGYIPRGSANLRCGDVLVVLELLFVAWNRVATLPPGPGHVEQWLTPPPNESLYADGAKKASFSLDKAAKISLLPSGNCVYEKLLFLFAAKHKKSFTPPRSQNSDG